MKLTDEEIDELLKSVFSAGEDEQDLILIRTPEIPYEEGSVMDMLSNIQM